MQIEEQIKSLLKIKAKIDLYRKVVGNIEAEKTSKDPEHVSLQKDHPGLITEFCDEILDFCNSRIQSLGNPTSQAPKPTPRKEESFVPLDPPRTDPTIKNADDEEPRDPLRFLMKYKNMEGKSVTFKTKDGVIKAKIRGCVAPNLVVETEMGVTLQIPPRELTFEK